MLKKKKTLFKIKKILNKALAEESKKKTKKTPVKILFYLNILTDKTMEARVIIKKVKKQFKALVFIITGKKREALSR